MAQMLKRAEIIVKGEVQRVGYRSCGNQIPKREKYFILPIIMVHHQNIPLTHLPIT